MSAQWPFAQAQWIQSSPFIGRDDWIIRQCLGVHVACGVQVFLE
jgi:hypothetical protein